MHPSPSSEQKLDPSKKNLIERLQQHADAWKALVDTTQNPGIVYDAFGLIHYVNKLAADWLDRTTDDLYKAPLSKIIEGETPQQLKQPLDLESNTPIQCLFKTPKNDAEWTMVHQQPIIWMDQNMTLLVAHRNSEIPQPESALYHNFFENLNVALEGALELLNISDMDDLYSRAVTIARERLGFERVGIKRVENEELRFMFGTDNQGQTVDERGCEDPFSKSQYEAHAYYQPHKPRYLIKLLSHHYFDENKNPVPLGEGWNAATPVWGPNNKLLALISNDTAMTHAAPDGIQQKVMVLYAALLGAILHSKLNEFEHLEMQRRFTEMADTMNEVFWVTNNDGSEIQYVSPAFESLWNLSREALYKTPSLWLRTIHPDDRNRIGAAFAQNAAQGTFSEEYRIIKPNGEECWVWDRGAPVFKENGEVARIVGIVENITKFKLNEHSLREAETRYRSLVEHLPSATYILDAKSKRLSYISPQIKPILGLTIAQAMETSIPWLETIHPKDRDAVSEKLKTSIENQTHTSMLYRTNPVKGTYRWIRHDTMIHKANTVDKTFLQGTLQDVTLQQQNEEKERDLNQRSSRAHRLESLAVLAGGVAHDLNNLLGPVLGYPDLILDLLEPNHPAREDVQEIKKSAQRSADVIQDLLTLARQTGMEVEPVDILDVTKQYIDSASCKELEKKYPHITLETTLPSDPLYAIGSIPRMTQIIMNLILNAHEAMNTQPGKVNVSIEAIETNQAHQGFENIPAGRYVVFSVQDEGSGLRMEDRERIFEPFYTRKKLGRSGSGLGLAVVYGLVKDLEGYIDVDSEIGEGALFSIFLPRVTATPLSQNKGNIPLEGTEPILILDDLPEQQILMKRLLGKYGYEVHTAGDIEEAMVQLSQHPAKLVLIDMILDSDLDGLDAFRRIRGKYPDLKCILITGFAETDRVKSALREGANGIIHKPFTQKNITQAVRKFLDQNG